MLLDDDEQLLFARHFTAAEDTCRLAAQKYISNKSDVEDVVQTSFVHLMTKGRAHLKLNANEFRKVIYVIAKNVCYDINKKMLVNLVVIRAFHMKQRRNILQARATAVRSTSTNDWMRWCCSNTLIN